MKTRAFIALDLPEEAINEIKQIQENIKRKFIFTEISSKADSIGFPVSTSFTNFSNSEDITP